MTATRIVFIGTPGAGKTTAIATLSAALPVVTDLGSSDARPLGERTMVGRDGGQVDLGDGQSAWLIDTPGQLRFEFIWQDADVNALGLVILIDNSREDPLDDLAGFLKAYRDLLPSTNCVIGVGRMARHREPTLDDYADALAMAGVMVPVLGVDVRNLDDLLVLVDTVLVQVDLRAQA